MPESERKAARREPEEDSPRPPSTQFNNAWFRFFLTFDPRPTLRKVQCPVLAINGEKDLQVPPKENLAEIDKALKAGGNRNVKTVELPGLNHLFQPCKTGAPERVRLDRDDDRARSLEDHGRLDRRTDVAIGTDRGPARVITRSKAVSAAGDAGAESAEQRCETIRSRPINVGSGPAPG